MAAGPRKPFTEKGGRKMKDARIVIAVDADPAALVLQSQLRELRHRVIGAAADGAGAVAICAKLNPDLVIMDINMRSLNDFQAAKTIAASGRIPVIVISGSFDEALIEAATQAGVSGFLIKPVDARNLAPAIELTLKNHSRYQQTLAELKQLRQMCRGIGASG